MRRQVRNSPEGEAHTETGGDRRSVSLYHTGLVLLMLVSRGWSVKESFLIPNLVEVLFNDLKQGSARPEEDRGRVPCT